MRTNIFINNKVTNRRFNISKCITDVFFLLIFRFGSELYCFKRIGYYGSVSNRCRNECGLHRSMLVSSLTLKTRLIVLYYNLNVIHLRCGHTAIHWLKKYVYQKKMLLEKRYIRFKRKIYWCKSAKNQTYKKDCTILESDSKRHFSVNWVFFYYHYLTDSDSYVVCACLTIKYTQCMWLPI